MKDKKAITCIKKDQNLFDLNLAVANKVMKVKTTTTSSLRNDNLYTKDTVIAIYSWDHLIKLVNKSYWVNIKYYRFDYISNTRVIRVAKLFT